MLSILADDFSSFPFETQIKEAIDAGRKGILLVPEQLALATERQIAERFPPSAPLFFEVSNFSRLADRAFRAEGGLSYRYADRAAEIILMWKTLECAAPFLSGKRGGGADAVKESLSALGELSASGLTPSDLRRAAAATAGAPALSAKLSDLALITELFEGERQAIFGSHAADLDKLLAILKEKPLFADTEIYLSGFTSFTAKELAILGELARAGKVSVSLSLPKEGERALCYEETTDTKRRLFSLAERVGSKCSLSLPLSSPRPAMLAYAKEMLFRADGDDTAYGGEDDGSLSLLLAEDPYDGCAHIAAEIAAAVRKGDRYRDFAVLVRSPEKYDGILDDAFLSAGVPFFFSGRTDITELSLSKMILSAYGCLERNFRREDLIAYMKCGFCDISADDADRFELYAATWKLKGRAFAADKPFDMHPDGYADGFTEKAKETLARINGVREKLLPPLWSFREKTEGAKVAREHCEALYEFLCALGTERTLHERAKEERRQGRADEADRLARLSTVLYGLLDRICEIMGEIPLTRSRFSELLALLFSSVSLGSIPTAQDAVTIENADTFRPSGEKTVFLLGAVEGEFPAPISLGGVFREEDRQLLEALGYSVGQSPELRASREQLSFLRGLAAPAKRAVAVCFKTDAFGASVRPGAAYRRLKKLFPTVERAGDAPEIFTPGVAAERFFDLQSTSEGEALAALLSEDPSFARLKEIGSTPIFDPACSVSEKTAARLFPDRMRASQSKLEQYLNCPFAYFCKRALRLGEDESAAIRSTEVGNIMHAILERFFSLMEKDGVNIHTVLPDAIPKYVEDACRDYLERICPPSMQASPRLSHLFSRVRVAATLVVRDIYDEFAHSSFSPAFCELSLEEEGGPGALVFRDADGKSVLIGGRIDRVDTYRAENGELFVRVVDYKTGSRAFSREELRRGRNMQMFLYLCAIWKTERAEFLSRLGLKENEHPLPAGILYSTANPKAVTLDAPTEEEVFAEKLRRENFARRGFFLSEEAVITAMDDDLSHLPISRNKNGQISFEKKDLFGSLVEFGEMLDDTEAAVLDTARRMRSGCADIAPDEKTNPCSFCPYRAVCRIEGVKTKPW